jgi:hypothetical protein
MATPPDFTNGTPLDASSLNKVGMWLVKTVTVGTGVSTVPVTDCFSADYDNYLITVTGGTASSDNNLNFQFSGITGSVYATAGYFMTYGVATVNAFAPSATTSWLAGQAAVNNTSIVCTVTNPFLAKHKGLITNSSSTNNYSFTGQATTTASTTGFSLFTSAGATISGQVIRVYAYRN